MLNCKGKLFELPFFAGLQKNIPKLSNTKAILSERVTHYGNQKRNSHGKYHKDFRVCDCE